MCLHKVRMHLQSSFACTRVLMSPSGKQRHVSFLYFFRIHCLMSSILYLLCMVNHRQNLQDKKLLNGGK